MHPNAVSHDAAGRCQIADYILELAACDDSVDEWRYFASGNFAGFTSGANNEFMACWETGDSFDELQEADGRPLHQAEFQAAAPAMGCTWSKVQV